MSAIFPRIILIPNNTITPQIWSTHHDLYFVVLQYDITVFLQISLFLNICMAAISVHIVGTDTCDMLLLKYNNLWCTAIRDTSTKGGILNIVAVLIYMFTKLVVLYLIEQSITTHTPMFITEFIVFDCCHTLDNIMYVRSWTANISCYFSGELH